MTVFLSNIGMRCEHNDKKLREQLTQQFLHHRFHLKHQMTSKRLKTNNLVLSRAFNVATGTFWRIIGTPPTGLLHSFHRNNTSLHRPLKASLWFVTWLSLRFLWSTENHLCLGHSERSLAAFLPTCRCTGSRSQCSFPRACRSSQH